MTENAFNTESMERTTADPQELLQGADSVQYRNRLFSPEQIHPAAAQAHAEKIKEASERIAEIPSFKAFDDITGTHFDKNGLYIGGKAKKGTKIVFDLDTGRKYLAPEDYGPEHLRYGIAKAQGAFTPEEWWGMEHDPDFGRHSAPWELAKRAFWGFAKLTDIGLRFGNDGTDAGLKLGPVTLFDGNGAGGQLYGAALAALREAKAPETAPELEGFYRRVSEWAKRKDEARRQALQLFDDSMMIHGLPGYIGEVIGSTAGSLLTAVAVGSVGGLPAVAAVFGSMQFHDLRAEYLEKKNPDGTPKYTIEEANRYAFEGGLKEGLIEMLGFKFFRRWATLNNSFRNWVLASVPEGLQEALQSIAEAELTTATGLRNEAIYGDDEKAKAEAWKSILLDIAISAAAGGIVGFGGAMLTKSTEIRRDKFEYELEKGSKEKPKLEYKDSSAREIPNPYPIKPEEAEQAVQNSEAQPETEEKAAGEVSAENVSEENKTAAEEEKETDKKKSALPFAAAISDEDRAAWERAEQNKGSDPLHDMAKAIAADYKFHDEDGIIAAYAVARRLAENGHAADLVFEGLNRQLIAFNNQLESGEAKAATEKAAEQIKYYLSPESVKDFKGNLKKQLKDGGFEEHEAERGAEGISRIYAYLSNAFGMDIAELRPLNLKAGQDTGSGRAAISLDDKIAEIIFGKNSDLSSVFHEFMHYFTDVIDRAAAQGNAKAAELKKEIDRIASGYNKRHTNISGQTSDEQKLRMEAVAEAFEMWLYEDRKAGQDTEADRLFKEIQDFFRKIYDCLKSISGVRLDPDTDAFFRKICGLDDIALTEYMRKAEQQGTRLYQKGKIVDLSADFNKYITEDISILEKLANQYLMSLMEKTKKHPIKTGTSPLKIKVVGGENKKHIIKPNIPLSGKRAKLHKIIILNLENIIPNTIKINDENKSKNKPHNTSERTKEHKRKVELYVHFTGKFKIIIRNDEGNSIEENYTIRISAEQKKGQDARILNLYNIEINRADAALRHLSQRSTHHVSPKNSISNNTDSGQTLYQQAKKRRARDRALIANDMKAQKEGSKAADKPDHAQLMKEFELVRRNGRPEAEEETFLSKTAADIGNAAADAILSVRQRAGAISRRFKYMFDRLDFTENEFSRAFGEKAFPFVKKYRELKDNDRAGLDFLLLNGMHGEAAKFCESLGMGEEYKNLRHTLDEIHALGTDSGIDMGFIEDYFPTKVRDYEGLITYLKGTDKWTFIELALERLDPKGTMTPEERAEAVNKMLRGYDPLDPRKKPDNAKERKIFHKHPNLMKFYEPSDIALLRYMSGMAHAIAINKAFHVSDVFRASETVGAIVHDAIQSGLITRKEEKLFEQLLKDRITYANTPRFISMFKNFGYLGTMNNFTSAITQLGDLYAPLYMFGTDKAIKGIFGKKEVTVRDLGLETVWEELRSPGADGIAVKKVFDIVGLSKLDRFGKENMINAALADLREKAARPDMEFMADLADAFGGRAGEVLADIKAGKTTFDVKMLLWNRLADTQPIGISGMPSWYLKNGGLRLFYQLKTYTLTQLSLYWADGVLKMRRGLAAGNKKLFMQGAGNFCRLLLLLTAFNAGADLIKNLLMGRKVSVSDTFVSNLIWNIGVSKYSFYRGQREGYIRALLENYLPPQISMADEAINETVKVVRGKTDIEDTGLITYMPYGRAYYWWFGGGRDAEHEKDKKAGRDGRPWVGW